MERNHRIIPALTALHGPFSFGSINTHGETQTRAVWPVCGPDTAQQKGRFIMKEIVCTIIGVLGGGIAAMFGGWDAALTTLVIFMAIDYATGLIVAGVFHKSKKTDTGTLESRVGWKGLCRKGVTLLIVLVACRLDLIIGSNFIRDAAVIAFVANETISIIENAGLMGVPIPAVIIKAVDVLTKKAESEGKPNADH